MKIQVSKSKSFGVSKKSSFDSALESLGVNGYNIIEYSSVIPDSATVKKTEKISIEADYGEPIGCVVSKAFKKLDERNDTEAVAELVWNKSDSGHGWFVEGNNRRVSDAEITEMCDNRPQYDFDYGDHSKVSISHSLEDCRNGNPTDWVCCMCIAVYDKIETESIAVSS